MVLTEVNTNTRETAKTRILRRQKGSVNLTQKSKEKVRTLKRTQSHVELPEVEKPRKCRKRKSAGDQTDFEAVKRLRENVVDKHHDKTVDQLHNALLSRVKFVMSIEQRDKVRQVANDIGEALRTEYPGDLRKYMSHYRKVLFNLNNKSYSLYKALLKEKIKPSDLVKMESAEMLLATKSKKAKEIKAEKRAAVANIYKENEFNIAQRPIAKLVNDDYVEIIEEHHY